MWMDISTSIRVEISTCPWKSDVDVSTCLSWIYPHQISKGRWIYPYTGGRIHLSILGQVDISTSMCGYIHLILPRPSGYIHIQVDVSTCLFKGRWIYPFTGGYIHLPILGMCGYIHTTFPSMWIYPLNFFFCNLIHI